MLAPTYVPPVFRVPATWSAAEESTASHVTPAAAAAASAQMPMAMMAPHPFSVPQVQAAAAAATAAAESDKSSNEMSPAELKQLSKQCLAALHALIRPTSDAPGGPGPTASASQHQQDRWYMALLVTATLCFGLAPRSQALAQLCINSSFLLSHDVLLGGRHSVGHAHAGRGDGT